MDRTAIRNFAIFARNKLIEDIKERATYFGVTEMVFLNFTVT